jgi:hypothetical protein
MEIQETSKITRSHLLRMTMLSQRAVDYSIKSYEWKSLELCRMVHDVEAEWRQLQCGVGNRGRTLRATGTPVDSDSPFASCALRIFGALRVTYAAALQIAQQTMLILEGGRLAPSSEIRQLGRSVNGLVRLYTVALFRKEVQHAATILLRAKVRDWLDPWTYRAHNDASLGTTAIARLEHAIARSLVQIAEQAYEIGEAIILWLDSQDRFALPRKSAGHVPGAFTFISCQPDDHACVHQGSCEPFPVLKGVR